MFGLGKIGKLGAVGSLTTIQRAVSILRKYGTDAHAYIPGVGVLNGLTAGNYTDTEGTNAAVKDAPIGKATDALDGIHATQGTAGNKPVLRQGPVNMLLYSNDFSNATSWPKTGTTALISTTTAPDGTFAYAIAETSAVGAHRTQQTVATSVAVHTVSVYAKAATRNWLLILMAGGVNKGRFFDLGTGVLGSTYSGVPTNSLITDAGGGWYKCQITFTSTVAPVLQLYLSTDGTSISYAGNSSEAIYIWNAQFELGSTATDYIPTTSAKASTGVGPQYWEFGGDGTPTDYLSLGSVPFQSSDDHCIIVGASVNSIAAGSKPLFSNYGTTTRRVAQLSVDADTLTAKWTDDAGTAGTSPTGSVVAALTPFVATARKVGNVKELRKNGVLINSSSTAAGTTTLTNSAIGTDGAVYFPGSEYCTFAIKGTVSDSDLLLIEKLAANLAGVTL